MGVLRGIIPEVEATSWMVCKGHSISLRLFAIIPKADLRIQAPSFRFGPATLAFARENQQPPAHRFRIARSRQTGRICFEKRTHSALLNGTPNGHHSCGRSIPISHCNDQLPSLDPMNGSPFGTFTARPTWDNQKVERWIRFGQRRNVACHLCNTASNIIVRPRCTATAFRSLDQPRTLLTSQWQPVSSHHLPDYCFLLDTT